MRINRIDEVENYILTHKNVSIDKLCEVFDISKNTIRRDLNVLTQKGTVAKVYGGVTAVENLPPVSSLISFKERNVKNIDIKNQIACRAAAHIKNGDTIFIDTGSSTLNIIDYLTHLTHITVITNSVQVLYKGLSFSNINFIGLPGILKFGTASLVGSGCIEYLRRYNIGKAFMACTAVSLDTGVTNATAEEYEVKRVAMAQSKLHYLLVDHTKFDQSSLMTYCGLEDMNYIITDQTPASDYMNVFNRNHTVVDVADTTRITL